MKSPVLRFNSDAPKKAVNLSVNSELLSQAREVGLKLSQVFERALERETRARLQARWLEENSEAIDAYNEHVERDGVFSDSLREF